MVAILPATEASIVKATAIIAKGGLVACPTDTVYGLACDPFREGAVKRLFEVKRRESKPISVLCRDLRAAAGLVSLGDRGEALARRFWPGALTIVAPLARQVPHLLDQGTSTLGVRVPAREDCMSLIDRAGGYITGTSANISGSPSSRTAEEVQAQFGDLVDLILDGGMLLHAESTVVSVVGGEVTILRTGQVGVPDELMGRRTS